MADVTTTSKTIDYGRVATLVAHEVFHDLKDNVFGTNRTLALMEQMAADYRWSGGETLQVPLVLSNPGKATSFAGTEDVQSTPDKPWTAGFVSASSYGREVTLIQDNLDDVRGSPAAMKGLLARVLEVAIKDIRDLQNKHLWLAGTAKATDWKGFAAAIASDPTADTYLDVASASNTTWQNATRNNGGSSADILLDLNNMHTTASFGSDRPDILIGGRTERDAFHGKLTATLRESPILIAKGGAGNPRIEELEFGTARFLLDENRQSYGGGTGNVVVGLNMASWHHAVKPTDFGSPVAGFRSLRMDEFARIRGTATYVAMLRDRRTFFCDERRKNFVVFGLAAS